jgi:hypothetical protein
MRQETAVSMGLPGTHQDFYCLEYLKTYREDKILV